MQKKVLYLPYDYAIRFDEESMCHCLQELGVGDPKFVIKLVPSVGLYSLMKKVHGETKGTAKAEFSNPIQAPSDFDPHDDYVVQQQVSVFMKTCIIPIAVKTRALILVAGANDCCLSKALSDVAFAEKERIGANCPFTVLATADLLEIHHNVKMYPDAASTSSCVAGQVLQSCKLWQDRRVSVENAIEKFVKKRNRKQCDLVRAASKYIIFEGFNTQAKAFQSFSRIAFEAVLLKVCTHSLPIIAIQSHHIDVGLRYLSNLAQNNIPVLLLDASERAISMNAIPEHGPKTHTSEEVHAFPYIPAKELKNMEFDDDGMMSIDGRKRFLDIAMRMIEEKWSAHISRGFTDSYDASMYALLHSAVRLGSQPLGLVSDTRVGADDTKLYQEIKEARARMKEHKELISRNRAIVPIEIANKAANFVIQKIGALETLASLSKVVKWIIRHCGNHLPSIDPTILLEPDLDIDTIDMNIYSREEQHSLLIQAFLYYMKQEEKLKEIIENDGIYYDHNYQPERLAALIDVFTHPNFYSGSLHDIGALQRKINSISSIDRLPTSNSIEALLELQNAWDHVDKYHTKADSYKLIAKFSYLAILGLGIIATILSILNEQKDGAYHFRNEIIIVGFTTTALLGYVAFINPSVRWHQLRIAALSMESHIFMFRCRAGIYRPQDGDISDEIIDKLFHDHISAIKQGVLDGADIQNTDFYAYPLNGYNHHEQHDKESIHNHEESASTSTLRLHKLIARPTKTILDENKYQPDDIENVYHDTKVSLVASNPSETMSLTQNNSKVRGYGSTVSPSLGGGEKKDQTSSSPNTFLGEKTTLPDMTSQSRTAGSVQKQFGEFGKEVKKAVTSIYDKVIHPIAANSTKIHSTLTKETTRLELSFEDTTLGQKKHEKLLKKLAKLDTPELQINHESDEAVKKQSLASFAESIRVINRAKETILHYPIPEQPEIDTYLDKRITSTDIANYLQTLKHMLIEKVFQGDANHKQEIIEHVKEAIDIEETEENGIEFKKKSLEKEITHEQLGTKVPTEVDDDTLFRRDSFKVDFEPFPKTNKVVHRFDDFHHKFNKKKNDPNEESENISLYHLLINHSPQSSSAASEETEKLNQIPVPVDAIVKCLRPAMKNELDLIDNHFEIISPDLYVRFRLLKSLQFYKDRLPRYYMIRIVSQVVQVIGSLIISALAIWDTTAWTAAATVFIAAVAAYVEFHGTDEKIKRYSATIHGLEELINWWNTLLPIDRFYSEHINTLILRGEDIVSRDSMSWKATSQAVRLLQSSSLSDNNKNEKNENKGNTDHKGNGSVEVIPLPVMDTAVKRTKSEELRRSVSHSESQDTDSNANKSGKE